MAQSLNANLKKPCIVRTLHNTLFFHRGLFKGRSHPKSPCIYLLLFNNLVYKSGFQNIAIGNYEGNDVLCIAKKLTKPVPLASVFGALKCTTKGEIKPIFLSPKLHLSRAKSLDDYFSKKQQQAHTRKTKYAFVPEVHQRRFADTFTGYIVAAILGKVIFPITLSCYNNKLPGWRLKMKATFSKSAPPSFSRGMQLMASSRNLILVSSCSLRRSLFCFQPLLQEQSRLFSLREFLFFLDNPKII